MIKKETPEEGLMKVEAYIAAQESEKQERLRRVQTILQEVLPETMQTISWQMPTFYKERNILHFAAMKSHIGLYPGAEVVEVLSDRLTKEGYKFSKGAIQLSDKKELPDTLIAEVGRLAMKHNSRGIE